MDIKKSWLSKAPIAHRGLHTDQIPENSLASFSNAILHGYAIEIDVRMTDDKVAVVFHDETLKRMTNCDGYLSSLKSSELGNYNLLKTDEKIPTLEETLKLVDGQVPLLIELKTFTNVGALEQAVIDVLKGYKGDFAVQSFNPYSVAYFKNKAPGFLRGLIAMNFTKEEQPNFFKRVMLSKMKLNHIAKPDFITFRGSDLPNKYAAKSGLPVIAFTIKSNGELEKVIPHCNNIVFEKFVPQITKEMGQS